MGSVSKVELIQPTSGGFGSGAAFLVHGEITISKGDGMAEDVES